MAIVTDLMDIASDAGYSEECIEEMYDKAIRICNRLRKSGYKLRSREIFAWYISDTVDGVDKEAAEKCFALYFGRGIWEELGYHSIETETVEYLFGVSERKINASKILRGK